MSDDTSGKQKEFRKSFKNYDLVVDKTKIVTAIVIVIAIVLFNIFMFYISDIFK